MDGSAGGVAYRPGCAQLLHDRLFEFGELHSSGANAGHIGSGVDDTNQRADGHRGQLSLGFCRGDILRIPLSGVRLVVIRCSLSRQFFAGTAFSSAHNTCIGMSGIFLGTGSALFSGVFFPTQLISQYAGTAISSISRILPPTYGLDGIRRVLIEGEGLSQVREPLLTLLLCLVILLPFSLWVFGRAVRRAKREGSLIQY